MTWQRPASGANPTGWEIHYSYRAEVGSSTRTGSGVHPVASGTVPARGVTLENLVFGAAYTVRVKAKNGSVSGPFSASVTATTLVPATTPAVPGGLIATGGDGFIDLSWDNPSDGSIAGYQLRERPSFDDDWWCWTWIWNSGPGTTSHRVPQLPAGATYQIQLRALNAVGAGPAARTAATLAAAPPGPAPAAPAGLAAAAGDRSIALSWNNPADPTIIGYQFKERAGAETGWRCWRHLYNTGPHTTSHTMRHITNNLQYHIQLRALNPAGPGTPAQTATTPTPGP